MKERIIRIKRHNPEPGESGEAANCEELFRLPGNEKMTVLQALQQIYEEQDSTLAFEYSCRYGRCGLCAVEVNGKPLLACTTFLHEGETTIGPLSNLPLLRDLVIDRRSLEQLIAAREIYFVGTPPAKTLFVRLQAPDGLQKLLPCLECLCCHASCPGIKAHASDLTRFAGPFIFLKLAQLALHPRDMKERRQQALNLGLEYCQNCRKCRCPQGIPIYREAIEPFLP